MAGRVRNTAPPREAAGFTVVELLATITLVAILAAFALPRFSSNAAYAQRGDADEIAGALRLSRDVAIASNCAVQLRVNAAGYSAFQRAAAGNACASAGGFVTALRRDDGTNLAGWPPNNANVAGAAVFVFGPEGSLQAAPPPPLAIGPFRITVDAGGWVQVQ
jgi:prepilin-type N-terminal cleavage/methylation domain-containing protein